MRCIAPMRLAKCAAQAVLLARNQHQVYVVGHEPIGPGLRTAASARRGQQLAAPGVVVIAEEGLLAAVRARRREPFWPCRPPLRKFEKC